ncbi:hypothetical protein AB833_20035 [Chromatiales bacterium (ex Bugula neritina AB1)]|nr:hypothetical protein AB833_20035 [Chromatiales bacterium (ex Bugula neritina AB1)]
MRRLLRNLQQSLTTRLLLLFAVASCLLVALLVATLAHGFASQWRTTIHPHISQYLDYVNADIGYPPDQQRATELASRLPINIYIEGPDVQFSTTGSPLDLNDLEFQRRSQHRKGNQHRHRRLDFGEHRDRSVLRNKVGDYQVYYELPHSRPRTQHDGGLRMALLALLAILALCYFVLRRMLRPVQDIQAAVGQMGAGQLDTRVTVRSNNDLGALAGSINTMANDIQQMLDAKRQLLLGASHELRTPITRAKIATQMLPESENRNRIEQDLQEMESLISGILESERMKAGHSSLTRVATKLPALVHSVLQEMQTTAVTTEFDSNIPEVQIDETRTRLLLRNLISNALTHGHKDKPPVVKLTATNSEVTIHVIDQGDGIEPAEINKVTEPFYRTDQSRTRSTGGFGLGLHLCDLIVKAHGGQLAISSTPGSGTTVSAALPRH